MCIVSTIMDYGRDRIHPDDWNRKNYDAYRKLIEQAQKFDKITQQPHCEDPTKMELLKRIEERLDAIEKKINKPKRSKRRKKSKGIPK